MQEILGIMRALEVANSNITVKYLEEARVLLVIWTRTRAILGTSLVRPEIVQTSPNTLYRYAEPLFLGSQCHPFSGDRKKHNSKQHLLLMFFSVMVHLSLRAAKSLT